MCHVRYEPGKRPCHWMCSTTHFNHLIPDIWLDGDASFRLLVCVTHRRMFPEYFLLQTNSFLKEKKKYNCPTTIQECKRETTCVVYLVCTEDCIYFWSILNFSFCVPSECSSFHAHCWCGGHSCFVPPIVKNKKQKKKPCKFAVHFRFV